MAARKKIEDESIEAVPEPEMMATVQALPGVPVDKVTVSPQGDMLEITYSRSWKLAVVQYEDMSLFTSIKRIVPVDSDLEAVGTEISDQLNDIQGADLVWARSMCTNRGSLVTKVIPNP